MSKETSRRRDRTRARLVEAAVTEFSAHGIDGTSIERLCETAGFSRGAFYSNFSSKDDLCVEIVRTTAAASITAYQAAVDQMPERMELADLVVQILRARPKTHELLLTLAEVDLRAQRNPGLALRIREVRTDVWPAYWRMVEQAADRAGLDLAADIDDVLLVLESLACHLPQVVGETQAVERMITMVATGLTRSKA